MNTDELCFDNVDPIRIPVKIGKVNYVLCEATAADVANYRNFCVNAPKLNSEGSPEKLGNIANAEPLLVSLCLYTVDDKGGAASRVSLAVVNGWKNSITKKLFEKAKEISDLDDDTVEALERQIAALQKRLAKVKAEVPKDSPVVTTGTCESAESSEKASTS